MQTAASDEFTGRLLRMHQATRAEAMAAQPVVLGLHRSDYMIDDSGGAKGGDGKGQALLQVELNTIASSFGCLAAGTAALHRFLLERHFVAAPEDGAAACLAGYLQGHPGVLPQDAVEEHRFSGCLAAMPPNPSLDALPGELSWQST